MVKNSVGYNTFVSAFKMVLTVGDLISRRSQLMPVEETMPKCHWLEVVYLEVLFAEADDLEFVL